MPAVSVGVAIHLHDGKPIGEVGLGVPVRLKAVATTAGGCPGGGPGASVDAWVVVCSLHPFDA